MPLGPYLDAAAAARRFSERMCAQWGIECPHLADVADELVAAALVARKSNLHLRLSYDGEVVRMQLVDARVEPPVAGPGNGGGEPGKESLSSRDSLDGLAGRIVAAYTADWGTGQPGSADLFWAELPVGRREGVG